MNENEIEIDSLEARELQEGDVLVVNLTGRLRPEGREQIERLIEMGILEPLGLAGKVKIVVLEQGITLDVFRRGEGE